MKFKQLFASFGGVLFFLAVLLVMNATTRAKYVTLNPKEIVSAEQISWSDKHNLWKISLDTLPPSVFPDFLTKSNLGHKSLILFESDKQLKRRRYTKDLKQEPRPGSYTVVTEWDKGNVSSITVYFLPLNQGTFTPLAAQLSVAQPFVVADGGWVLVFIGIVSLVWGLTRKIIHLSTKQYSELWLSLTKKTVVKKIQRLFDYGAKRYTPPHLVIPGARASAKHLLLLCVFFVAGVAVVAGGGYSPLWLTNDDVIMSMLSHGYGVAFEKSERIIFSKVLWGRLIQALPKLEGVLGYSLASMSAVILAASVSLYCLLRLGLSYLVICLLCLACFAIPMLSPQFTITAGMATVAAVLCLHTYCTCHDKVALFMGCILAYTGFLIRDHEFLFVALVALPLFPLRKLIMDKLVVLAGVTLVVAIVAASIVDKKAYNTKDMELFTSLQNMRVDVIDYNLFEHLKSKVDDLGNYGLSMNDLMLFNSWFFLDENVCNIKAYNALRDQYKVEHMQNSATSNIIKQAKSLVKMPVLPMALILCMFMGMGRPSRCLWWSVICFILFLIALAVLGRPAVFRVVFPPLMLLVVFSIIEMVPAKNTQFWRYVGLLSASLLIAVHLGATYTEQKKRRVKAEHFQSEYVAMPVDSFISWGAVLPFEYLYPVLGGLNSASLGKSIQSWGWDSFLPNTNTYRQQVLGGSFSEQLSSREGSNILLGPGELELLETYCEEHWDGVLDERLSFEFGKDRLLVNIACVRK